MKRALLIILLLAPLAASAHADWKIVVHRQNAVTEIRAVDVASMMTKKTERWPDGTPVVPVDQRESATVRQEFSRAILHRPTAAVKSYWRQRIFSGAGTPPVEHADDAAVLEFVRKTPGAIGYVSAGAPTDGVRVVLVR